MASSSLELAGRSVFLSHNGCQKPWVRRVAAQWRDLGLKVFFDEDSIAPGENVIKALERGISESKHVVLFLSPASLESRWVAMEIAMTQVQDPAAADRRLIPVLVEPVDPDTIGPSIRCLSITDLTDEQSRDDRYRRLLQSLLGASSAELPPPPPFDPGVSQERVGDDAGLASNGDGGERATTAVGQVGLELTIQGNLNDFTPERQASLLRAIQALLETTNEIRIRSIRPGSIIVTLNLSAEEAERLYWAVQDGALDGFGVKRARVLEPESPSPSPPKWSGPLPPTEVPEPPSAIEPSPFIRYLRARLTADKGLHDLSRNVEFARFPLIGYRTSAVAVELVAFCMADGLTESEIVARRNEFFDVVRRVPRDFGLKPRGRNPTGLLAFVFAEGCPEPMARFVRKQTQISHGAGTGGVVVSWAVDLKTRRVHTHENPVSVFPPVMVMAQTVYPGLGYLELLLQGWEDEPADAPRAGRVRDAMTYEGPPAPDSRKQPAPGAERKVSPAGSGRTRILFLAANSRHSPLDLEWEYRQIETDLRLSRERENLELRQAFAVTPDRLIQAMLDESPTIVHFAGHGTREGLVLRDESGESQLVPAEAVANLFKLFRDRGVRCVVLNACWTEAQARAIRQHVPHVVGTRIEIEDQAAVAFSAGFYKAIGAGEDIPFAFETGKVSLGFKGIDADELVVLL